MISNTGEGRGYSFGTFQLPPFSLGRFFPVAHNPRDPLQFGDPTFVSWVLDGWSASYLLLVAAAAKPQTVVKIVASFTAPFLATDSSGDVVHAGGSLS